MNPRVVVAGVAALISGAAIAGFFAYNRKKAPVRNPVLQMGSANMRMIATAEITERVASEFKLTTDNIQYSEKFETALAQYIRVLNPSAVPFLTEDMNLSKKATYSVNEDSILFRYDSFSKEQQLAMAAVLEQYFAGINTVVVRNEPDNNLFWLRCDKKIFLEHVLPKLASEVKITPEKVAHPEKPIFQEESYTGQYRVMGAGCCSRP